MKRLSMLAVALVMVLGMAVSASAAPEVSISGNILMNAAWKVDWDAVNGDKTAAMQLYQRSDLYFTITANENLKGVLGLRSIRGEWGQGPAELAQPGGGDWTLGIRDAFIEFAWPGTEVNVKAGVYNVALPAQVGGASMILADRAGALMVSSPITENVSVLAGYSRLGDSATGEGMSQTDAWLLAAPLSFEGVAATPYFLYAAGGDEAELFTGASIQASHSAWWMGSDLAINMFDPFILKADFAYGATSIDSAGWLLGLGLDYTGFDFMTVETYFFYTSGEDDDNDESERIAVLADDFALGSFYFGGGSVTGDDMGAMPVGFWTLGVSLTGIESFLDGMTHDFHALYVSGTNNTNAAGLTYKTDLTTDDSLFELDFNTAYTVYDELTLFGQLGYINADYDSDVWGSGNNGGDAWKIATGVVYQF